MSAAALASLVDNLYAGTLDDSAWDSALVQTADLVQGSGIQLFAIDIEKHQLVRNEAQRVDPDVIAAYSDYWHTKDVLVAPALALPEGLPYTDYDLVPSEQFTRTEIWNELMAPADCPHLLMTWLHKSDDRAVCLSIKGTFKRGRFQGREIEQLGRIIPHFQRAICIRDRLEANRIRASTLPACLDRVAFAVFLLDVAGRIVETNALARDQLRVEPGVKASGDRTLILPGTAGAILRRWIATGMIPASQNKGVFHVHRMDGRAPLSVVATPLQPTACGWISSHPRWLVLVFDPERCLEPSAEFLVADLHITPREAQLAALLCIGYSVETAAKRLGIRLHTARNHLKSVFAKTGFHTQAQLVRRVLTSEAMNLPKTR